MSEEPEIEALARRGGVGPVFAEIPLDDVLPVALVRSGELGLVTPMTVPRQGDELSVGVARDRLDGATAWLLARGWRRVDAPSNAT